MNQNIIDEIIEENYCEFGQEYGTAITNLLKANKQLKKENISLKYQLNENILLKNYNNLKSLFSNSQDIAIELQNKINKAVEYIRKNYIYMPTSSGNNYVDSDGLLEILRGDSNEK